MAELLDKGFWCTRDENHSENEKRKEKKIQVFIY